MFMSQGSQIEIDLIESVLPTCCPAPCADEEAVDLLRSSVIEGFERAIDLGVPPLQALTYILDWVSDEMARVKAAPVSAST
ncbi:hypothetical protein T281_15950 [Rhodomicrobium udaipurense JA643]|uniref:Uncharacterized protein n=1 Tax=Rhodomicrobium udaipurense TaxID=1202716 RepID=A0A8I1GHS7_9HYPH|nr:hypothetical protein [Rhodomicrobium udaipurense]KAI93560.1 hypothetical protein T281_15950 [Rhodomicrobium udaipurense JA643]MBJ7545159.1 hypothetical protein [Rhodomicrobium udaipurense]